MQIALVVRIAMAAAALQCAFAAEVRITGGGLAQPDPVRKERTKEPPLRHTDSIEDAVRSQSRRSAVNLQSGILPRYSAIAILMRGESFRCYRGSPGCFAKAHDVQLNGTRTFRKNVIAPLEELGNRVDVFYIVETCEMQDELLTVLGANVKNTQYLAKTNNGTQKGRILTSLQFVRDSVGPGGVNQYALFLMVRVDQVWLRPLTNWKADWSLFNFASPCSGTEPGFTKDNPCVNDAFYTMPGRAFETFAEAVDTCYLVKVTGARAGGDGHHCKKQMSTAMANIGLSVGFAIKDRPVGDLRSGNPYAPLITSCNQDLYEKFFDFWSRKNVELKEFSATEKLELQRLIASQRLEFQTLSPNGSARMLSALDAESLALDAEGAD